MQKRSLLNKIGNIPVVPVLSTLTYVAVAERKTMAIAIITVAERKIAIIPVVELVNFEIIQALEPVNLEIIQALEPVNLEIIQALESVDIEINIRYKKLTRLGVNLNK